MIQRENIEPADYVLDAFEPSNRIRILALNPSLPQALQRITSAEKAASPDFQAWLHTRTPAVQAYMLRTLSKLLAQRTDVPTPAGLTPRQVQSGLVQIEPTKDRRE